MGGGKAIRTLLAVAMGIAAATLLWVAILETFVWNPTGYVDDPELGRIYRPGIYVHGTEGFSYSRINSLGMRGPEVGPRRPGTARVLFLGDSFTEALQVFPSRTFAERTGAALREGGMDVEVVNAGRSGASPASHIYLAEWYRRRIDPDVVVVQLSCEDFTSDLTDPKSNFYLKRDRSNVSAVMNTEFHSAHPVAQKSRIVREVISFPLVRLAANNINRQLNLEPPPREFDADVDRDLVEVTVHALSQAYDHPVILYVPGVEYDRACCASEPAEALLRDAARRRGIPFVDVGDEMLAAFAERRVASHGFANTQLPASGSHLNAAGHGIVATKLTPVVREELSRR
ncbi:MAG: SGNH/GDSL hydrolase family protein [Coriobacteriales bacterium]|nr:SGNH/GDSL hydrolase family protein [Coriobacteriales bacterium]